MFYAYKIEIKIKIKIKIKKNKKKIAPLELTQNNKYYPILLQT